MTLPIKKKSNKNPSFFSHEFVIQNHADILSCVLMIFIVALYFQVSKPFGSTFVALNHNMTVNVTQDGETFEDYYSNYTTGMKDTCFVFFYLITFIIYHAVIQEYILDKSNKKLHLSKVKTSKFNESGGLLAFYLPFLAFAIYLISQGFVKRLSDLWSQYPTLILPWNAKLFFLLQIAAWLHFLPELYFQKIPKDEWDARCLYIALYAIFISAAYILNFTKLGLILIILQYFEQSLYHMARILYFAGKEKFAKYSFMVWDGVFIITRFLTVMLVILCNQFLAKSAVSHIDWGRGNFNVTLLRLPLMGIFGFLQVWMVSKFFTFYFKRMRENNQLLLTSSSTSSKHYSMLNANSSGTGSVTKGKKINFNNTPNMFSWLTSTLFPSPQKSSGPGKRLQDSNTAKLKQTAKTPASSNVNYHGSSSQVDSAGLKKRTKDNSSKTNGTLNTPTSATGKHNKTANGTGMNSTNTRSAKKVK